MSRHRKTSSWPKWLEVKGKTLLLVALLLGVISAMGIFNGLQQPSNQTAQEGLAKDLKIKLVPTAPGHWLMTPEDYKKVSSIQDKRDDFPDKIQNEPKKPEKVRGLQPRSLNKILNNLNIMYLWTDEGRLKVLSIMTINRETKEAALVVIPRFTRIEADGKNTTVDQLYKDGGRQSLSNLLEKLTQMKIPNYLNVDQQAVREISNLVGPLALKGEKITILEAFEQTRDGKRTDDQDVVRAVARKIVNPKILLDLPKIIWIFTHDVKSNLGTEELLAIYRVSRESRVTQMSKMALPGEDIMVGDEKYRLVSKDTWQNVFYDLTK